jgi:foldase protein PrsA
VLLASLAVWKKNWFVAAIVNNRPITTIELYQKLNQRYGKDVLDSIIQEKLIGEEARKQKVTVSTDEVDKKLKEIEDQLGGKEALDYALASQGISLEQAKEQIKTQLIVEKILGKDIQVSDKDVEAFIKDNPTAKDLSKDKVKEQVRSQKISEKFQTWIEDLKKKAKISKFI